VTQELVNTAVQLAVVLAVALVVYLFFGRKSGSFPRYVGLIAPKPKAMGWAFAVALVLTPATLALYLFSPLREVATGPNTVVGLIRAMGPSADTAVTIVIVAFFKTALAEEILFRGLIAKRLMSVAGFWFGNVLQATLFASVHLLVFVVPGGPAFSLALAVPVLALVLASAMVMAWLNERLGGGSIGPSWLLHGIGNATAYPVLAFA
jgi:membrane protease YdiL (CAAX protease family)